MDLQRIKEQSKKIMAFEGDASATEHEIENALRFVRRLMLKHNVTEEDLAEVRDGHEAAADAEAVDYGKEETFSSGSNLSTWEWSLVCAINKLVGTTQAYKDRKGIKKTVNDTIEYDGRGRPKKATPIVFYGPVADCRDAAKLFDEWAHVIASLARMKYGGALKGKGRCYAEGFTLGLNSKLDEIKREERILKAQHANGDLPTHVNESTALVVINATAVMEAKKKRGSEYLRSTLGIKLRRGSGGGGGMFDPSAFNNGRTDGRSANFSRGKVKRLNG